MIPHLAAHLARHPAALLPSSRRASVAIVLRIQGAGAGAAAAPAAAAAGAAAPPAAAPAFLRSALAASSSASTTEVLFIKRAARDGDPWSGHVAFPGGKNEGESDMACAARETLEEVGLDLAAADGSYLFLGRLDDHPVYTGGKRLADSAYCVGVWVQTRAHTPPLALQRDEVAEVRWVRVSALLPERVDARGVRRPAARYLPPWLCALLRVRDIYLPAIDLPAAPPPGAPAASSSSSSSSSSSTQFLLWGMTLQATSDLVQAAGAASRPLNWPPALGDSAAADFCVRAWCGVREVAGALSGRGGAQLTHAAHAGALGAVAGALLLAGRHLLGGS